MFVDSSLVLVSFCETLKKKSDAGFLYAEEVGRAAIWAGGTHSHVVTLPLHGRAGKLEEDTVS